MENGKLLYKYIFVVWMLCFLSACSEKPPQPPVKRIASPVVAVTYRISSVSEQKTANTDHFLIVFFGGSRSASKELSWITGFSDTATFYRKAGDSTMIVSQQLPWRKAVFKANDKHASLIPDSLMPEFVNETDTILGYACQKAVFRKDQLEWEVWFAPKLQLKDSTGVLIAHPGVNGTILKAIRSYRHRNYYAATIYQVTSLEFDQPASRLKAPVETVFYSEEDPKDYFLKEFDSLTARQDSIPWQFKDRFLGKWQFNNSRSGLTVERYGEVYVLLLHNYDPLRFPSDFSDPVSVRFYKDKLWFSSGSVWHWLAFCKEDQLCSSLCSDCKLTRKK